MSKKLLILLALLVSVAVACGSDDESSNNVSENNTEPDAGVDAEIPDQDIQEDLNNTMPDMSEEPDMNEPPPPGEERIPSTFSVLPPIAANCDAPDSRQRIPFMYNSVDVVPVVEGDIVNGRQVLANVSVDSGSIAARRGRISVVTEGVCTDDSECPSGFKCATAGLPGAQKQCTTKTGIEFIPQSVSADVDGALGDREQLVALLTENTTSLVGRLPTASGTLFDESGERDVQQDTARATDLQRVNRDGIEDFALNLASVASSRNTKVGIWWFGGDVSAQTRPLVDPEALSDHFTSDLSIGQSKVNEMPEPVPRPGNVYQAMLRLLPNEFGLEMYEDHEKFLMVFTDGPNEVYDPDNTFEDVVREMTDLGVRVYIIHLDNGIDSSLIRDLPTIWGGNSACQDDPTCGADPCAADSECPNYAECRPVTIYAENQGDPVTTSDVSYCMPRYGDDGRIGPVDEYADIACRTGGSYIYVSDPEQMRRYYRILPTVLDGQFSIEADFSALSNPVVEPGFYRLSTTLLGLLGPNDLGTSLSSPTPGVVSQDSRPVVRLGRPANP